MIELVKEPVPLPSVVLLFAVVGLELVLQQTPLAVTVPPPSEVPFPPLEAVVPVMELTEVVVTAGSAGAVVPPHQVAHDVPLYICISPEGPQSEHHTIWPVMGEAIARRWVRVTLWVLNEGTYGEA